MLFRQPNRPNDPAKSSNSTAAEVGARGRHDTLGGGLIFDKILLN